GLLKFEAARVNNTNGSIAVNSQTSTWLSPSSCSGTGNCTYTMSGFTSTPFCLCNAAAAAAISCDAVPSSSTSLSITTWGTSGTLSNENGTTVFCFGSK
ncbi:MAG: hypothetical protein ACKOX6_15915, partial [Bdellovibrio sp.]